VIATFFSLIPIALLGAVLRVFLPGSDEARQSLNRLVLFAFLPALVFHTVMTCPVDGSLLLVPVVAGLTTVAMLGISLGVFHFMPIPAATKGAMILAAAFGNVIYLDLPLLQGMFPKIGAETAAGAVLFQVTTSNISLTLGAMVAIAYGSGERLTMRNTLNEALSLPPIWALAAALAWRMSGIPCPEFLLDGAGVMSAAVTGMMILSLGMALRVHRSTLVALILPVAVLKLLVSPWIASLVAGPVGMSGIVRDMTVLEAAMPTQLLTFVIAARFRLDEATLSLVIFANTILAMATLPLVQAWLGSRRGLTRECGTGILR
jgi:predicted permease